MLKKVNRVQLQSEQQRTNHRASLLISMFCLGAFGCGWKGMICGMAPLIMLKGLQAKSPMEKITHKASHKWNVTVRKATPFIA